MHCACDRLAQRPRRARVVVMPYIICVLIQIVYVARSSWSHVDVGGVESRAVELRMCKCKQRINCMISCLEGDDHIWLICICSAADVVVHSCGTSCMIRLFDLVSPVGIV